MKSSKITDKSSTVCLNVDIMNIIFEYRGYVLRHNMDESEVLTWIDICGDNSNKILTEHYNDYYYLTSHEPLLLYCCKKGFDKSINILLSKKNVNMYGYELNYAPWMCNVDTVKNLIEHGAKLNSYYWHNYETPLHDVINIKHTDVVKLLLKHGADINLINGDGITPFVKVLDTMRYDVVNIEQYKIIAMEMLNYKFDPDVHGRDSNTQLLEVLIHECIYKQLGNNISTKILKLYPDANLDITNIDGECARNYLDN